MKFWRSGAETFVLKAEWSVINNWRSGSECSYFELKSECDFNRVTQIIGARSPKSFLPEPLFGVGKGTSSYIEHWRGRGAPTKFWLAHRLSTGTHPSSPVVAYIKNTHRMREGWMTFWRSGAETFVLKAEWSVIIIIWRIEYVRQFKFEFSKMNYSSETVTLWLSATMLVVLSI